MQTQASRVSWIESIIRYRGTRLPGRLYVPLALFIATAALTGYRAPSVASWCLVWLCAYLYIFQFRLWDDLTEVEEDCRREPERVLCRADSLTPFYWFSLVLAGMILVLLASRNGAPLNVFGYLFICTLAGTWYRFQRARDWSNLVRAHIVLLKYPLFVVLIGIPFGGENLANMIVAAVIVYETLAVYEIIHDRRYRGDPVARNLLILHALPLVGVWLFVAFQIRYGAALAQTLNALAIVAGVWFLYASLRQARYNRAPPLAGVPVFVTSFACCLSLVMTSYPSP